MKAQDIGRARAMEALLGEFPGGRGGEATELAYVIRRPVIPSHPADFAEGDVEVWIEDSGMTMRHESGVVGRARPGGIVIGGDGKLDRALNRLFLPMVSSTLARRGVFAIHGGAIAVEGKAWLILGPTGRGKSTMAGIALGHHWELLADDAVVLRGPDPTVQGISRAPAIPKEIVEDAGPSSADHRGRVRLSARVLTQGRLPIVGALIPRRMSANDEKPRRLDASLAVSAVVGSLPAALEPVIACSFLELAAEIARRPFYTFPLHRDPVTRRRLAVQMLDDVSGSRPDALR